MRWYKFCGFGHHRTQGVLQPNTVVALGFDFGVALALGVRRQLEGLPFRGVVTVIFEILDYSVFCMSEGFHLQNGQMSGVGSQINCKTYLDVNTGFGGYRPSTVIAILGTRVRT